MSDFKAGDRVRYDCGELKADGGIVLPRDPASDPGEITVWWPDHGVQPTDASCLTLVSRPVYPGPGQEAVLLDDEDIKALRIAKRLAGVNNSHVTKARISAILDRAREAS